MNNRHYPYIDALRGYAILAVIATHSFPINSGLEGIPRKLVDQGARGVELFFLISALTLAISWHSRHENTFYFYLRRIFRIAPLFWLGVIFYSYPTYWSMTHVDFESILRTVLFLNGWSPDYFNRVVPGGWSVAVEINFYIIFPILMYFVRGYLMSILFLLISLLISYWLFSFLNSHQSEVWPLNPESYTSADIWMLINLWLPNELPIFLTGIALYFAIQRESRFQLWVYDAMIFLSFVCMTLIAIRADPWTVLRGVVSIYFIYGLLFAIVAFALARGAGSYLVNKLAINLGKVSFSAYLWHFEVIKYVAYLKQSLNSASPNGDGVSIQLIYFGTIVISTYILSCITYAIIERPVIQLGEKFLVKRLRPNPYC